MHSTKTDTVVLATAYTQLSTLLLIDYPSFGMHRDIERSKILRKKKTTKIKSNRFIFMKRKCTYKLKHLGIFVESSLHAACISYCITRTHFHVVMYIHTPTENGATGWNCFCKNCLIYYTNIKFNTRDGIKINFSTTLVQ